MIYSLGERKLETRGSDWFVADNATVIGSVVIENDVSIWFNAVVRGDNDLIILGEGSNVQDGCVLHVDEGSQLRLHRHVTVGHLAMLHGCTIGAGSLIGINAVVLEGAVIGEQSLVAANTLIPEGREIPPRSLVVGTPGRVVRELRAEEIADMEERAVSYIERFKRYKRELRKE